MSQFFCSRQLRQSLPACRWRAALALVVALAAPACSYVDDTGTACGNANALYPANAVANEKAVVDPVTFRRDPICQTFQCLTTDGLPPYCTRACKLLPVVKGADGCQTDINCDIGLRCDANTHLCTADDCPAGFACTVPVGLGNLAHSRVCTRVLNCDKNKTPIPVNAPDIKCQAGGVLACTKVACYDSCPNPSTSCPSPNKECRPQAGLNCTCNIKGIGCPDANLVCQPGTPGQTWVAGSFTSGSVCLPTKL